MARDDLAFAFILVGSVAFSALLRQFPAQLRPDAAAIVGAAAVVSACGPQCLHLAVALALAVFALNVAPPHYRERISFAIAFGHLAFVRLLPSPPGGPTNAAMLMLTLRLGAADATSSVELIRYACCYHGLFTGPYYSYAEWQAAMRAPQPLPTRRALWQALLAAVSALAFWRAVAMALPYRLVAASATEGDGLGWVGGVLSRNLPLRLVYFYLSSFQFRWRFYACWLVMELSGLFLGVAHPANVEIRVCELAMSPSALISGWNTSVQSWLKERVYRRLPKATPRSARMLATFAVSAFWHGVHPGYYLMFAGLFVMVGVEQLVRTAWPPHLFDKRDLLSGLLSPCCHLWTMGCFSFYGGAFNLLGWREVWGLWASLHYYGIWLALLPAVPAALKLLVVGVPPSREKTG